MKIETWNMKGGAALLWYDKHKDREISPATVDKLMDRDADIFVLTEFCALPGWDYFQKRLLEKDYVWFMGCLTGKNGILICVKSTLVQKKKLANDVHDHNTISFGTDGCNFLRVTFFLPPSYGAPRAVTVIGCRMETSLSRKSTQKDYDSRREAFDKVLMPVVKSAVNMHWSGKDIIIVCGDFNNAQCHGDLTKKYDPEDYRELAQINYNLNIIKDTFDSLGFQMMDQRDENGVPKGIPTWHSSPLDHIFVKGLRPLSCCTDPMDKLSDHYLLSAEVLLPDDKT